MMIQNQRKLFLSLRQQFHSYLKFNTNLSRSSTPLSKNPNPNSQSFSTSVHSRDHQSHPFRARCLISRNSSLLISNWNPNPNSQSFSTSVHSRDHQSHHFRARCLISRNSSLLISNWISRSGFATRLAESSNRPPKETILLEGCDMEHWLVVVEAPDPQLTRDDIIDSYIKTLTHVVGSEEEARMKIYSVSTRHYYAFSALLSEELAYKLKDLPHVRWVLPDSYMDVKNKTYAGEPFINGHPVPYDPKYHEIWVRNHEQALRNNTKNKRRPRDPNSSQPRPRSPSTFQNQAPQTSNPPNQTSRPSSSANPELSRQNWGPATSSSRSSEMQNSSKPPSFQSQAPQHTSPWNPPPPQPVTRMDPNSQNWAYQNDNWTPVVNTQNQAQHPTQHTQMQNHSLPRNPPPPQPSARMGPNSPNWANENHNWTPVIGPQNQAQYSSQMPNQTPPSSSSSKPYTPAWNGPTQSYESRSPQPPISNNNIAYDNTQYSSPPGEIPSHVQQPNVQNDGSRNDYPSQYSQHQQFQNSDRDRQSSNAMISPQWSLNYQNANMKPSTPTRDMPSQVQQNGYSDRNIPSNAQNGFQNGYRSRNSEYGFRDSRSSNANMAPQVQNHQGLGTDMNRQMQNNEF